MNIIVIGLGSMGRRRIGLITKYDKSIRIIGIDKNPERAMSAKLDFGIEISNSIDDVIHNNKIDCAFICTSPLSHANLITICLKHNLHVFTELNLVLDKYKENLEIAKTNKKILFLSSTFLYREEIKKIKTLVNSHNKNLNYSYHAGQYLPDWHPWESYKDFFIYDKKTNGCREIFAIELPWIVDVFGKIVDFKVSKSKISSLDLDYYDNYFVILEHESGHKGVLIVDVVSRKAVRNLEVFGEELFLKWDGSGEGLFSYDINAKKDDKIDVYDKIYSLEKYTNLIVENAYYDEIVAFFLSVKEGAKMIYDFEKDMEILEIINKIEGTDEYEV